VRSGCDPVQRSHPNPRASWWLDVEGLRIARVGERASIAGHRHRGLPMPLH
jgi:hypothetical protein